MRARTRKVLAGLGGLVIFALALAWAFGSARYLADRIEFKTGVESDFASGDAIYKKYGDLYTIVSFVGLALASAISFAVLAWERRPPSLRVEVVFAILLALALPLSFINYWSYDAFVSRSQQVVLNLVEAFLAAVCVLRLMRLKVVGDAAVVLRSMASFFLLAFGFFMPMLFSMVWFLHWEKVVSKASSDSLAPGWVSAISGIAALAVSIQQYRLAKAKQGDAPADVAPKIVVAP